MVRLSNRSGALQERDVEAYDRAMVSVAVMV